LVLDLHLHLQQGQHPHQQHFLFNLSVLRVVAVGGAAHIKIDGDVVASTCGLLIFLLGELRL
jgi:hypothetical protein